MTTPDVARKLAALLFSDIKGYSSQMDRDEEGALRQLAIHNGIFDRQVVAHSGRTVKTVGDAYMIEFSSAVDAVRCGLAVQQELAAYNRGQLDEDQIWVRMGIHVGDVIIKGDDLFGETVNIAARLEPKAPPGQICVSQTVFNSVRRKVDASAIDMGEVSLKNIHEPFQLYALAPSREMLDVPSGRAVPIAPAPTEGAGFPLGIIVAAMLAVAALGGIFWYLSQGSDEPSAVTVAEATPDATQESSSGVSGAQEVRGGTLRWGIEGKRTTTFDLTTRVRSVNGQVLEQVFDPLLRFDAETDSLMPGAVVSWETSDDAKTITLKLREGVHFHPHKCLPDGKSRPATAADLAFSITHSQRWDRSLPLKGLDAFLSGDAKTIAGVLVDDRAPNTVRLQLDTPSAFALQTVASDRLLPRELASCGDLTAMEAPPGTGPFFLASPKPGFHFRLEAWGQYWDRTKDGEPLPLLAAIDISAVQDAVTALSRVAKGALDTVELGQDAAELVLDDVRGEAPALKKRFETSSVEVAPRFPPPRALRLQVLIMLPGDDRVTQELSVRRSIAQAIDRELVAPLFDKTMRPTGRFLSANMEGYDAALPILLHDPEAAKAALKKRGTPIGDFTIGHFRESAKAAASIKRQLEAVGIKARPVEISPAALNDAIRKRSVDAIMVAWQSSTSNQEPYPYLHSMANTLKSLGWEVPQANALVDKMVTQSKRSERSGTYRALEELLVAQAHCLPLAVPRNRKPMSFWLSRSNVQGLQDSVTKRVRLTAGTLLQHVWVRER